MDIDRITRAKGRALTKRAAIMDRIEAIYSLAVKSENDTSLIPKLFISAKDLDELLVKFVIENDALLDAMLELGEGEKFSTSAEIEVNDLVVSTKAFVQELRERENVSSGMAAVTPATNVVVPVAGPATSACTSVSIPLGSVSTSLRLPEILLPSFDGDLHQWPVFRDRFVALVDSRSNILNVEKFYYLLSCLQSEAAEVVKGITVSNDTYTLAWSALTERYDKPRRLASSIVESLLSAPVAQQENLASLNAFLNSFDERVALLNALNLPDLGAFLLFTMASRCLPVSSRRLFESVNTSEYPNVYELIKFVKGRIHVLENAGATAGFSKPQPSFATNKPHRDWQRKDKPVKSLFASSSSTDKSNAQCPNCKGTHPLKSCPAFLNMNVRERYEVVSKFRLCMACFSDQHWSSKCKFNCPTCKRRHHRLLHPDGSSGPFVSSQSAPNVLFSARSSSSVLLGTVLVLVRDASGGHQPVRALIDSGSQISIITATCSDRLGLSRSRWTASVMGLAGQDVPKVSGMVHINVQPCHDSVSIMSVKAWVLPSIASDMPSQQLSSDVRARCLHLNLADPHFDKPGPVELLLGADVFPQIWSGEQFSLGEGLPSAYKSIFGWIIIGPVSLQSSSTVQCLLASVDSSVEDLLEKFWKVEEPEEAPLPFTDDGFCESIFRSEASITKEGRYSVPLPFRLGQFSHSFNGIYRTSLKRFEHLERRLAQDDALAVAYRDFMSEYETLGHMSIAKEPGLFIIPHHAVCKQVNGELKLRVVFDASARCSSGQSLNDTLFPGPKLQRDVIDVLLGFRLYRYAFATDICKMYRQVLVNTEYRRYQHILWRSRPTDAVKEYALNTITYGVNCAPFLALRVLYDIADRYCSHRPNVKNALQLQTYMDDICTGSSSIEEALSLQYDLVETLSAFGFDLKKWISNAPQLLAKIPVEDRAVGALPFNDEVTVVQVLGLKWNPEEDVFSYDVSSIKSVATKRGVLSVIARIFDPLGFLSPVLLYAKSLMQLIWKTQVEWDDPLPDEIDSKWSRLINELNLLSSVRVPRYVGTAPNCQYLLCGFCDASERGYAALIYLRVNDLKGNVTTWFLGAKTKLAPLHDITIPRLELCAAGLLASWMARVKATLSAQLSISGTVLWTDSSIVLSWLTTPHISFKIFVSNRVHKIQQLLPDGKWYHVPSGKNPADCASRGLLPSELNAQLLYWQGPDFLLDDPCSWDINVHYIPLDMLPEVKVTSLLVSSDPTVEWIVRFSSFQRMLRVITWIRRFVLKCRKLPVESGVLTRVELDASLQIAVKCAQQCHLQTLHRELTQRLPVSSKPLAQLSPFVDINGVIRVGGRLTYAQVSENRKHPILLAKSSHLSILLARHWHLFSCHSGPRLMMSLIGKQFWILSVRRVIGKIIKNCTICVKMAACSPAPVMADLPPSRVIQCRPFSKVGIDYAGPLSMRELKLRKAREYKVYIAVFICMTVKAVHLEVVLDLTSDAFLAAFDRFVARRGLPSDIFTDCGTNFIGASKQLKKLFSGAEEQVQIAGHAPCKWHFNPPSAPHFGGIWEAAVRSMKTLLVRTIGTQSLTLEELTTVVYRIEAVLNSRPLTPLSSDPCDLESLTPSHFLIGQPLLTVPQVEVPETQTRLVNRWKLLHQSHQAFWKRWSIEYLNTLQQRSKWVVDQTPVKIGDMVVIKDNLMPPLTWRLGRIVELLPGPDGVIRVVKVLTKQGIVTRPVIKLVLLPTE